MVGAVGAGLDLRQVGVEQARRLEIVEGRGLADDEVGDELDHRYLNDLEPFKTINPTAENIAAYMYKEISAQINSDSIKVTALTLWETERACVRYSEENE